MNKKGQVTIFVIVGIIIAVLVGLIFFLRSQMLIGPVTPEVFEREMDRIGEEFGDCVIRVSTPVLEILGKQGGYLNPGPDTYRLYNDSRVSYLCYNIEGEDKCYNRMLTVKQMEEEIKSTLDIGLLQCGISRGGNLGYDVSVQGNPNPEIEIEREVVKINVNYPIKIKSKRTGLVVERKDFIINVDVPLGALYDVAMEIVNSEAEYGDFDPLIYMLAKKGEYKVYKHKPYPDKVYIIKKEGKNYIFQFFVQSEPVERGY